MGYMAYHVVLCKVLGLSTCRAHTSTLGGRASKEARYRAFTVELDLCGGAMRDRLPILCSALGDAGQLVQDSHPESPSYLCGNSRERPHG